MPGMMSPQFQRHMQRMDEIRHKLLAAWSFFQNADPDHIDLAIYQLNEAQQQYNSALQDRSVI